MIKFIRTTLLLQKYSNIKSAYFFNTTILLILFVTLTHAPAQSQGFNGFIIGGFNAAQLEGDNLSGYNKVGLNAGLRLEYPMDEKKGVATELILHQKGSSSTFRTGTPSNVETLTLNYLALPIYYYFNEWKHESADYYRFQIEGGMIINRLFGVSSSNSFFNNATDAFKDWDISLSAGLAFRANPFWKIGIHFERSITKIYELPNSDLRGLQSYLINIRAAYQL